MKIIDISAVDTGISMPTKKGTWQFLQDSYKELFSEIFISKIGFGYSTITPYVIYGCETSISGGNTNISKGAIFFNGEIYLSPAQSVTTPAGSDVIYASIDITQYTTDADPVTFSDTVARNVHNIRTCKFFVGASGSGNIGDIGDFVNLNTWTDLGTSLGMTAVSGGGSVTLQAGDIIMNRYRIEGKTIFWNIQLRGVTISGAVNQILLGANPFTLIQSSFHPTEKRISIGLYNSTATLLIQQGSNSFGPSGTNSLLLSLVGGGNFTAGTDDQNFDIQIIGELLYS